MSRALTIVALAGLVSASSFSIGCMTTLMSINSNADVVACLGPSGLLPILVGAGNGGDSIIAPIDSWLQKTCPLPACSPDTISTIITSVSKGCATEFDLPSVDNVQATVDAVNKLYGTVRKAVCLKEGDTMCVTQSLTNLQSVAGTLTLNDDNVAAISASKQKGFPTSFTCTNCMKGAFSIINQELPGEISPDDVAYAKKTCGDAFVDGGIPPGLIQTALGAAPADPPAPVSSSVVPVPSSTPAAVAPSPSKKSSALGRSSGKYTNLAISALVLASTAFTYLA